MYSAHFIEFSLVMTSFSSLFNDYPDLIELCVSVILSLKKSEKDFIEAWEAIFSKDFWGPYFELG